MNKMSTGEYILHALKHFVKMVALIAIIYILMYYTNTLAIGTEELLGTKGLILLVALVALSASYPSYGFVQRELPVGLQREKNTIIEAMRIGGYTLSRESDNELIFRASSPLKQIASVWDDGVTVRRHTSAQEGVEIVESIIISGPRKGVSEAEFRISSRVRINNEAAEQ